MTRAGSLTTRITAPIRRLGRAVAGKARIRRVGPLMAVVVSVAALIVGLYYVWSRMQMVQTGYEISELERKNRDLQKRARELMLEIASLQSPSELEKKASKIGLIFPEMGKVLHVP